MKRFALLSVCLISLAALNGCCHHGWGGGGYCGNQCQPACGPCGAGYGGYGAGYGGYPAAVGPGAYSSAYTIASPVYAPTTAMAPLNALPTY
jgi:hypothetical protein